MKSISYTGFSFPVGFQKFHKEPLINHQLNRPYCLGYSRFEDMREAGRNISSFAQGKEEMLKQASRAVSEDRIMNAAFHYRTAESFTFPDDPDRLELYDRFLSHFNHAFDDQEIRRRNVPFEKGALPVMVVNPKRTLLGDVVLHGGYDSFVEEFYSMMWYFAKSGYRVISFDGPGQGAARRNYDLYFDYRWEKPVRAVLNHLNLKHVTLIGLSMGGYLALRASAFIPEISRVIASGHAYDYTKLHRGPAAWLLKSFRDHHRAFTNRLFRWKIRRGGVEIWNIRQLMYILGVDEPMAALDFAFSMNEENLHSDLVRQHVLLLSAEQDHFIPFGVQEKQRKLLTSARSVTEREFNEEDQAHHHCQMGNIGLALKVMVEWMEN